MDNYDLFLQELNAITTYANNSNTDFTLTNVRKMLKDLLEAKPMELYGNRPYPLRMMEADTNEN